MSDEKRKVKLIGRVAKGEQIICEMLPEDLIDKYDAFELAGHMGARALEQKGEEGGSEESWKRLIMAGNDFERKRMDLWESIQHRYGYWHKNIGVRDGYALVVMPSKKKMNGGLNINGSFKTFLREMLSDEDDSEGKNPYKTGGFEVED